MKHVKENENFSVLIYQDGVSRVRKIKIVLAISSLALCAFTVNNAYFSDINSTLELLVSLGIIVTLSFFVTSDTTNIVAGILLWAMTILAAYFSWKNHGLFDTAIIAFPCVLIFSSMLGGRILFYPLVIFMLAVIYFFAYAASTGFLELAAPNRDGLVGKANSLAIFLLVYVLAIRMLSSNIKRLIKRLSDENRRSKENRQQADQLVLYDHLTHLPNSVSCRQELDPLIENSLAQDEIVGFMSLSLDNIKWINSSLGHEIGDKTICHLADRLSKLVSKKQRLYKCSGNEFILIMMAVDYEKVSEFAYQLIQAVNRSFQIDSYDIEVTCSIGIAIAPFDGASYQSLRQKSHMALSRTQSEESSDYKFFEVEMEDYVNRRLKMVKELKQAIDQQEFELFYQPKIDLGTNGMVGAEALIRWRNSKNELISPADFIPVAEASGLISEIGKWALDQACLDCKKWQEEGIGNLTIAVNLSPVQFRRGNLPSIVFRALRQANLAPSLLELEITESLFIDDTERISDQLNQIATKGISIAIDDFGTGYSNLNYLTKFNASTLKIDMSFVTNMLDVEQKQHIVNAIIKMSNEMGLENVAEGVEDFETVNKLKQFECQYGQGYFWSKPLPNNEFIVLVKEHIRDSLG